MKGRLGSQQVRGIFNLGSHIKNWGTKEETRTFPLPRQHAEVCISQPQSYYDYESSEVAFGFQDDYEFCSKLGRGRYSEVFKGVNLLNNETCVVKILKPGMT
jgi:casein kinase II subunit alpha